METETGWASSPQTEREALWGTSACDYIAPYGVLAIDLLYHADGELEWCYGRCGSPNVSTVLTPVSEEKFKEMVGQGEFDGVRTKLLDRLTKWQSETGAKNDAA